MIAAEIPFREMTRLLADLQTSILSHGLYLTDGDLDRFTILALIVRETAAVDWAADDRRCISIMSLASSLSKPYETVRRQVERLVTSGMCDRGVNGISMTREPAHVRSLQQTIVHAHDAFVRFIEDLRALSIPLPRQRACTNYQPAAGLQAAVDVMLSVQDGNRSIHGEWTQLAIWGTILSANASKSASQNAARLSEPIRVAAVARMLGMPATTVRRHVEKMAQDGRVIKVRGGWLVSAEWLDESKIMNVRRNSFRNVRRILERLASQNFPFEEPASAYIVGRPEGSGARHL